jgi:RNA polymerase sigma factor (sigma-70 family)
MAQITDEMLMTEYVRTESEPTFQEIYDRQIDRVRAYVFSHLLGRYRAFAEDVVQEIFLTLHQKRGQYDPDESFIPWLYAIITSTMIDRIRCERRFYKNHVEYDLAQVNVPSSHIEQIAELIDALDGDQQKMIREVFFERQGRRGSILDAAGAAGENYKSYQKRLSAAIDAMREKATA